MNSPQDAEAKITRAAPSVVMEEPKTSLAANLKGAYIVTSRRNIFVDATEMAALISYRHERLG